MTLDVHVPSIGLGGMGSSAHTATGSTSHGVVYEDQDDEVDQRQEEIGPSQLVDAPLT